jgi:cytochrome c oxidase assembly protein subunit 15
MALVIVALILYLIYTAKTTFKNQIYDARFRIILIVATVISLIQIILGTQVRQFVDVQNKLNGYLNWDFTAIAPNDFYIHRTLSILILVLNLILFFRNRTLNLGYSKINLVLVCIGLEIATGIAMYYFNFPFSAQPIHLLIAAIMIGIQFYIILESSNKKVLKPVTSAS